MRRRAVLAGGVALALVPCAAMAEDAALDAAMREVVGDVAAMPGGIELRVPAVAENGAQVPLTVLVDSAMTDADHVTAIHVFAPRNPTPGVASFHLFPGLARAEVQTRIRVAEEQAIVVLARMGDGTVRRASVGLKVTRGGCLS